MSTPTPLEEWLKKVMNAPSGDAVYKTLAEFRKLDWTDQDLADMSKVYMRQLTKVGTPTTTKAAAAEEDDGPDGPVWYEKM